MGQQVDLLPQEYILRRGAAERCFMWAIVALVLCGLSVLSMLAQSRKAEHLAGEVASLRQTVEGMRGWGNELGPIVEELKTAVKQQEVLDSLLAEPVHCALLSDIAGAADAQLWLTAISIANTPSGEDEEASGQREISISGSAVSNFEVIRFLNRLRDSEYVKDLSLETSQMQRDSEGNAIIAFQAQGLAQ